MAWVMWSKDAGISHKAKVEALPSGRLPPLPHPHSWPRVGASQMFVEV